MNREAPTFHPVRRALCYWYVSGVLVVVAVLFGAQLVRNGPTTLDQSAGLVAPFTQIDGRNYASIAREGYTYERGMASNTVCYPAYPLLGFIVSSIGGMRTETALLMVTHAALAIASIAMLTYARARSQPESEIPRDNIAPHERGAIADYALLSMLLFPTSMFARMVYTEALFLCFTALALCSITRRWPLWLIAVLVGAATGTRAVGIALVSAVALYIWAEGRAAGRKHVGILLRMFVYLPLACWGLLAFMLYLQLTYGDALASVKDTALWRSRPATPPGEKWLALATFEPVWSIYVPSSPAYWKRLDPTGVVPFSLQFANPLYFVFAIGALLAGIRWRWLNRYEAVFMAGLLAIPYFATSHNVCMAGMGRFVGAMLPLHLVIGHTLARLEAPLAALLLTLSGALMAVYAALFAAGYPIA